MADSNNNNDIDLRYYHTFPAYASPNDNGSPALNEVGGKALSLIETAAEQQFPVPPGVVLTVHFFQPWLDQVMKSNEWQDFAKADVATKDHCDAIKDSCKDSLEMTPLQQSHLDEAVDKGFGGKDGLGVVAVRSSSPEEDLAGTSFAGGYDTVLGVTSDTLLQSLQTCFSSVFDYRIVQYKIQHGMPIDNPRIAVVLQKQIASDVSGVAFSINPENNSYDEVMINANFGLGESVVGGTVTPDTYIVDRVRSTIASKEVNEKKEAVWLGKSSESHSGTRVEENQDSEKQALPDDKILEVARLTERVEEFRGGKPVDIEWAFQGDKLYLLQARPVTTYVPLFPEMLTKRGEQKFLYLDIIVMTQGFSEPMSVLGLNVWKTLVMRIKSIMSTEGRDGLTWNIHGREYVHLSNFMKTPGGRKMVESLYTQIDPSLGRALDSINLDDYIPSETPDGAKGILWKTLSQIFSLVPKMIAALFQGEDALEEYKELSAEMLKVCNDDDYMEDSTFGTVVDSMITKYENISLQIGSLVVAMFSRWRLHRMFSGVEGTDDLLISLCMDLHGNPTSEMGHDMVRLASFQEVQQTKTAQEFLQELKTGENFSKEFLSAYTEFMKKFGCRGMKEIDVATPRRYEQEEHFFGELKQIDLEKNAIITTSERRKAAYEKLLQMAKGMNREKQFVYHANNVQRMLGYREHPKYLVVVMNGMLRRRALKIGQQFVGEGRLERVEQIFDLTVEQISKAQENRGMEILPLAKSNTEPYKDVEHVKNWPMLVDSRGKIIRPKRKAKDDTDQEDDGTLIGTPISPGIVKGKAKVLHEPYEKPLKSGKILVARFTEPSWTPIFINAAGVIMEVGGPLQHGSIIAREYGIPCVSCVENATTRIRDGDMVELDGSAGTIKIIDTESIEEGEEETLPRNDSN